MRIWLVFRRDETKYLWKGALLSCFPSIKGHRTHFALWGAKLLRIREHTWERRRTWSERKRGRVLYWCTACILEPAPWNVHVALSPHRQFWSWRPLFLNFQNFCNLTKHSTHLLVRECYPWKQHRIAASVLTQQWARRPNWCFCEIYLINNVYENN